MKKKILIIDDAVTMTTFLEFLLGKENIVYSANSGKEALNWLDNNLPDLIISDIQMQEMDGFELLTHLRSRGYTKHIPVIMLSVNSESKDRIKCYQLGAQDHITKPFNPEELNELVKKNLYPIHYASKW